MFHTIICDMLGIDVPILQGAMQGAGGPRLAAAVSEAGGLGILHTFGDTLDDLRRDIRDTRALTSKPIAVNITPMGKAFTQSRAEVCIEESIPIVTTGRADPGESAVRMLKDAGIIVIPVVPSVDHAKRVEAEGVDAIIASGCEAGGHVGTVASFPLIPQIVDAVDLPVLAAGGIADGRGFLAALALGAVGVQIGTRFVATPESDAGRSYRAALLEAKESDTIVSDSMTGAPVRAIWTPEIAAYEKAKKAGATAAELKPLRQAVRAGGAKGAAGQNAGMINNIQPAAELMKKILADAQTHSRRLVTLADS